MFSEVTCAEEQSLAGGQGGGPDPFKGLEPASLERERLRALAQMASGMTHGLNNSLTPIIGYADFLLASDVGLSQEAAKCVRGIRTAAGNIAEIVERVRDFYRIRNSEEPLQLIDLNDLAKEVVQLIQPRWQQMAQRQGVLIAIESRLEKCLPQIREFDTELRDAATQLLLNGIEAMPRGGTLFVSTREIDRSFPQGSLAPDSHVVFEVRDTGTGMDAPTQQRCFEPFFSTKGPRHSGLGLSVVYGLMRRHGGTIELESEPGRGTTIRLLFNSVGAARKRPESSVPTPVRVVRKNSDAG